MGVEYRRSPLLLMNTPVLTGGDVRPVLAVCIDSPAPGLALAHGVLCDHCRGIGNPGLYRVFILSGCRS